MRAPTPRPGCRLRDTGKPSTLTTATIWLACTFYVTILGVKITDFASIYQICYSKATSRYCVGSASTYCVGETSIVAGRRDQRFVRVRRADDGSKPAGEPLFGTLREKLQNFRFESILYPRHRRVG